MALKDGPNAPQSQGSIPTDAELLQRARDIGPTLLARQAETEALTHYPEDVHEAF